MRWCRVTRANLTVTTAVGIRCSGLLILPLVFLLAPMSILTAEDETPPPKSPATVAADNPFELLLKEELTDAAARLKAMRGIVQRYRVTIPPETKEAVEKFSEVPILRYSDPARGVADGSIWRMGEKGRPGALVSLEIYPAHGRGRGLGCEFLAITRQPFELDPKPIPIWKPRQVAWKWQPIPDAPTPNEKAQVRQLQLRELSRRFSVSEDLSGEKTELRMTPQPLHRYQPVEKPNADGAIFAFVYGTNPEAVVLIETDGETWQFGCGALTAAAYRVRLDGHDVWSEEKVHVYNMASGYVPFLLLEANLK